MWIFSGYKRVQGQGFFAARYSPAIRSCVRVDTRRKEKKPTTEHPCTVEPARRPPRETKGATRHRGPGQEDRSSSTAFEDEGKRTFLARR